MGRAKHLRVVGENETAETVKEETDPESPNPVLVIIGADLVGLNINAHLAAMETAGFVEKVDVRRWKLTDLGNQACAIMMTLAVNDANQDRVNVSETANLHAYLLGVKV